MFLQGLCRSLAICNWPCTVNVVKLIVAFSGTNQDIDVAGSVEAADVAGFDRRHVGGETGWKGRLRLGLGRVTGSNGSTSEAAATDVGSLSAA